MNANAAQLLWETAARAGRHPAVVDRDDVVSYDELLRRAGAIARSLTANGLVAGQRVGVLLERGADAAAALFGVLAAGGVAVLMDEVLRPQQIEYQLAHSGAVVLITSPAVLARQPRDPATTARTCDVAELSTGPANRAPAVRSGRALAQIIYTSGSTGLPKGVMISHANLRSLTAIVNGYLDMSRADRIVSLLPFSFVYGLGQLLCAVGAGATLVVERSPLVTRIGDTLRARQVTVLAAVPSLWTRLLDTPEFRDAPLQSLRVMTNAGGALAPDAVRGLRSAQPHARLFLMYGLTEALRCTYLSPDEVDAHPDSIGRPLPGAEVTVLGDDGREAAIGETGELVYRGATVTLGYWRDAEATARVFRPDSRRRASGRGRVVHTGDLVRTDASGLLYFVGRKDRMVKTMGYRVSPHELVAALHASGHVASAAAVPEDDSQWGAVLVAHVVLAPTGSLDALREYCRRELPRYLRPARIEVLDALPLTANGKPDLAALVAGGAPSGQV